MVNSFYRLGSFFHEHTNARTLASTLAAAAARSADWVLIKFGPS